MLRSLLLVAFALLPFSIPQAPQYQRILFAGNSITRNPPAPGEPYFWDGYWGENASAAHRDYVHQVWAGISARQGYVPEMEFARVIYLEDIQAVGDQVDGYDLVVVQWGEAAPYNMPQEDWDAIYRKIKEAAGDATLVAVGAWGTHELRDKEDKLRIAAITAGMLYVPIRDLHAARTAEMCAGLHPGVCNHPNDAEMAAMAQRILAAIYDQSTYLPLVRGEGGGTVPPGK